jgi:hypothetical protein
MVSPPAGGCAAAHPEAGLSQGQPVGFAAVRAVGVSAEGSPQGGAAGRRGEWANLYPTARGAGAQAHVAAVTCASPAL